jgi:hypothetical protein
MKQIILSEEEAREIVKLLITSWVPQDSQKIVYELVRRIEKELEE